MDAPVPRPSAPPPPLRLYVRLRRCDLLRRWELPATTALASHQQLRIEPSRCDAWERRITAMDHRDADARRIDRVRAARLVALMHLPDVVRVDLEVVPRVLAVPVAPILRIAALDEVQSLCHFGRWLLHKYPSFFSQRVQHLRCRFQFLARFVPMNAAS